MMADQNLMDKSLRSVFVGNIPYEATEEKLKDIFSEVGPVLSFKLVYDRETGKPKGYGFCEYKDQETALSAMRNLNGYEIGGRTLRVDNACTEKSRMEMQSLLQGPVVENPYGEPVPPERAPEAISKAVASLPPEQMFELMKQMKLCIQSNPNEARAMLVRNPQLAYALLQAQVVMKIVDPHTAVSMLHKAVPVPTQLIPSDKPVTTLPSTPAPAPMPVPVPAPVVAPVPQPVPVPVPVPIAAAPLQTDPWPNRPIQNQVAPNFGDVDQRLVDPRSIDPRAVDTRVMDSRPVDSRPIDPRAVTARPDPRPIDARNMDSRAIDPRSLDRRPVDVGPVDPRAVDPRMARLSSGDQDLRMIGGPSVAPPQTMAPPRDPRENFPPELFPSRDARDPRAPALPPERFPPRDPRERVDPRTGAAPVPVAPSRTTANMTPPTAALRSALGVSMPPAGASDQEKAALIMQVLQLSDEQISMLPPDQRQSILVLKEQIAKSTHI